MIGSWLQQGGRWFCSALVWPNSIQRPCLPGSSLVFQFELCPGFWRLPCPVHRSVRNDAFTSQMVLDDECWMATTWHFSPKLPGASPSLSRCRGVYQSSSFLPLDCMLMLFYRFSIPMNIHGRGSCKPFYRHKIVFTIKWLGTAYKMSGPNPNENTIFWGGLTPEHLEITYKISIKWLVPFTNGQGASQQISAPRLESNHFAIPSFWFCHSFILFPMPPSANPGLSIGNFGIVWATCP